MLCIINKRYCNNTVYHSPLLLIDNNTVYHSSRFCGGDNLRAIQPSDLGDTLRVIQPHPIFWWAHPMLGCWFWVFLLILVFHCLWWRLWSHPSSGSKGPSSCGWEYSASRRKMPVLPSPQCGGVLICFTPHLIWPCQPWPSLVSGHIYLGFTICQHQWALTSLPPLHIHVPSDVHSHITIPKVFTHPWWVLWLTSMVEAITSSWSTPGKSHW